MESGADPVPVLQSGGKKIKFRLSTFATAEFTAVDKDWFTPQIFNNGGLDCVQYRKGKLIFVQIEVVPEVSLRLRHEVPRAEDNAVRGVVYRAGGPRGHLQTRTAAVSGSLAGYEEGTYKVAGMRRIRA